MAPQIRLSQNIFGCLQFCGKEAISHTERSAYCAILENKPRAWLMCYRISQTTARIRGLFVEAEYRRKGLMTFLLDNVEETWAPRVESLVSFSTVNGKAFHLNRGFDIVEDFKPRPVEFYDSWGGAYSSMQASELILMLKRLSYVSGARD